VGGNNIPKKDLAAAGSFLLSIFVFLCLLPMAIGIVWFTCFLSFAGITTWPTGMSAGRFLTITGVSLAMICGILGIGGATSMVELDRKVQLAIWSGFLASVLLTVGQWLGAAPGAGQ